MKFPLAFERPRAITRRHFFGQTGLGFGAIALQSLLTGDGCAKEADYRIPVGNPMRDYITIRPDIRSYDTASRQGDAQSLQVAHSVVTPGGWRRTAGIDYRNEQYEVSPEDSESVMELVPNITW